jgi:dephospho-CoA kinase
VACSAATQRARLSERGWPPEQIDQRIAAQLPASEKMSRADFVLWNEASLDVLAAQLEAALDRLSSRARSNQRQETVQ